jgi:ATP-dependent Clp protease ATP-binding subunit ClpB
VSNDSTHLDPTLRSVQSREFEAALRTKVVGQEEAVRALVDSLQIYRAEMRGDRRPVGNYLFLGPTGSDKTRIVEAAAEILFGDPRRHQSGLRGIPALP